MRACKRRQHRSCGFRKNKSQVAQRRGHFPAREWGGFFIVPPSPQTWSWKSLLEKHILEHTSCSQLLLIDMLLRLLFHQWLILKIGFQVQTDPCCSEAAGRMGSPEQPVVVGVPKHQPPVGSHISVPSGLHHPWNSCAVHLCEAYRPLLRIMVLFKYMK